MNVALLPALSFTFVFTLSPRWTPPSSNFPSCKVSLMYGSCPIRIRLVAGQRPCVMQAHRLIKPSRVFRTTLQIEHCRTKLVRQGKAFAAVHTRHLRCLSSSNGHLSDVDVYRWPKISSVKGYVTRIRVTFGGRRPLESSTRDKQHEILKICSQLHLPEDLKKPRQDKCFNYFVGPMKLVPSSHIRAGPTRSRMRTVRFLQGPPHFHTQCL